MADETKIEVADSGVEVQFENAPRVAGVREFTRWDCRPDQAEKHIATWQLPKGANDEIADCAAEWKRRDGTGARRATQTFRYGNGVPELIATDAPTAEATPPAENIVTASLARRILDYIA